MHGSKWLIQLISLSQASGGLGATASFANIRRDTPTGDRANIASAARHIRDRGFARGFALTTLAPVVKQSGGDVAVESKVGRGTTFTLYLPRVEGRSQQQDVGLREPGNWDEGRGRRLLVVEDNVEVGRFSTQLLQDLGYVTTWAANGSEAPKLLSEVDGFDVVFSDVVMPGMSGVELGEEIRRRYPGLPVVLTSGHSHVLAEEGRHGFELIQKPYAAEELSRVLGRVMRGRSSGHPDGGIG